MYSIEWFETFAATVPAAIVEMEIAGIAAALPLDRHRRLLDVGCGLGRIAGPLARRGYAVTGIDVNVRALVLARRNAPGPHYVGLDQRHLDRMRWTFDAALCLWNSLGFVGRDADLETLSGLARTLRPGGKAVFDLYHPDWLRRNDRAGDPDDRGAVVRRWTRDGRCFNRIRYPSGREDDIQFEVYQPDEMHDLATRAGFDGFAAMADWRPETLPTAASPRYQVVLERRR